MVILICTDMANRIYLNGNTDMYEGRSGWGWGRGWVIAPRSQKHVIQSHSDKTPQRSKIKSLLPGSLKIIASAPQLLENK